MVRVGRPVIVRHVTSVACARCVVVVAIVTLVATDRGVRPHQWVTVVVIARWDPSCLIVALRAIRGELGRRMVRVGGAIVVRHVAGITVDRCTLVTVGVALRAVNADMAAGKWETRGRMIV